MLNLLKSPMTSVAVVLLLAVRPAAASAATEISVENPWSKGRFALLQALSLPLQENSDAPASTASALGHALFYDTSLNPQSERGCVSCHRPELAFSDGKKHPENNPLKRNTPGLSGVANFDWFFWDGRKDSLWSQTLEPLYATHEINLSPEQLLKSVSQNVRYRRLYSEAFGHWPNPLPSARSDAGLQMQANLGVALAAFVEELQYQPAPYDRYIDALRNNDSATADNWLSKDQQAGLKIMLRSNCISCHRGSGFSDGTFHNIGTGEADPGRARGKVLWKNDALNCESAVALTLGESCNRQDYGEAEIPRLLKGAFKTPSLRELAHTAPYMHDGRYRSLDDVIEHYRNPPDGEHGLARIRVISDDEAKQLSAFLRSLSSPINRQAWYAKPPAD